jgi:SAM-dependent methyltransferase
MTYRIGDMTKEKVLRMAMHAKNPKQPYGGTKYDAGYHTLKLKGEVYKGQRDNQMRLVDVKFDFKDKTVLDIGCNVGGMLHELAPVIRYGVGIDRDFNCINTANLIRDYNDTHNINFYNFDLDNRPISNVSGFVLSEKIDICFFLSMIMWIKNWREVLNYIKSISNHLLIELNGENQDAQLEVIKTIYTNVDLIYAKSLDDPGQHDRRLYICNAI